MRQSIKTSRRGTFAASIHHCWKATLDRVIFLKFVQSYIRHNSTNAHKGSWVAYNYHRGPSNIFYMSYSLCVVFQLGRLSQRWYISYIDYIDHGCDRTLWRLPKVAIWWVVLFLSRDLHLDIIVHITSNCIKLVHPEPGYPADVCKNPKSDRTCKVTLNIALLFTSRPTTAYICYSLNVC